MEKIYSKIQPDLLLHMVYRLDDFKAGREEIIPPDQFIQCASLKMEKGKTFRPHKHIVRSVTDDDRVAQESWVVIRGAVRCIFYDINDEIIARPVLSEGDASFTLRGGHTYEVLMGDTLVYEYKTGKYLGQQYDKDFIE
jgi:hypothetical protein